MEREITERCQPAEARHLASPGFEDWKRNDEEYPPCRAPRPPAEICQRKGQHLLSVSAGGSERSWEFSASALSIRLGKGGSSPFGISAPRISGKFSALVLIFTVNRPWDTIILKGMRQAPRAGPVNQARMQSYRTLI